MVVFVRGGRRKKEKHSHLYIPTPRKKKEILGVKIKEIKDQGYYRVRRILFSPIQPVHLTTPNSTPLILLPLSIILYFVNKKRFLQHTYNTTLSLFAECWRMAGVIWWLSDNLMQGVPMTGM
jgi:hypothetical protein